MRGIITSPITAIILIILVILVGFALVNNMEKLAERNVQTEQLQARLDAIEEENAKIEQNIGALEGEDAIESEARQRLNLKKEGEEVVVVVPKEGERTETLSDEEFLRQYELSRQVLQEEEDNETNFSEWLRNLLAGVLSGREEVIE